jgi:transposase
MVLRVRSVTNEEGNSLRTSIRHSNDPIEMKRAQVILASAQGFRVQQIYVFSGMTEGYIRTLIHQFNTDGLAMVKPRWNPGDRHKFSQHTRDRLVALALGRPRDLGLPFGQWSLRRLRDTAVARGILVSISLEWLRVICDEADITHQSVRTWKKSTDPKFEERRRRIDRLTAKRHNPPVVLSLDEIGPISLQPHGGKGWFRKGLPGRIPATYTRPHGARYEYACLNVFHQILRVRQEEHKGSGIWLRWLKYQRAKYPPEPRVYMIQDGLSAHWTAEIRAWAKGNRVTLVPSATNASWMNPEECHAGHLQTTAMAGSDWWSWGEVDDAFKRAAALMNRENQASEKEFRGTRRRVSKHRRPLWTRH